MGDLNYSDWIAIVNSLATLFLSLFVYRATRKSAEAAVKTAELTEESISLNKNINEFQQEDNLMYRRSLKYQYVKILISKTAYILKIMDNPEPNIINENLEVHHYKHHISPENLALCFTDSEVKLITDAWDAFEVYLQSHLDNPCDLSLKADHVNHYFTEFSDRLIYLKKEIDH